MATAVLLGMALETVVVAKFDVGLTWLQAHPLWSLQLLGVVVASHKLANMPSLEQWLANNIGKAIVGAVLAGVVISANFLFGVSFACGPDSDNSWWKKFCDESGRAAWTVIPALAATPSLALTWYWRTTHRRQELAQYHNRFAQAAELLGSEKPATRQSAIYAFGQLRKDAPSVYLEPVTETLCAFVRDWKTQERLSCLTQEKRENEETGYPVLVPTDVRAAVKVLCARVRDEHLNLRNAFLQGAVLPSVDLRGADLRGADLTGADLRDAKLDRTNATGAHFVKAQLSGSSLMMAHWRNADLSDANLELADLRNADFDGSILQRARFKADPSDLTSLRTCTFIGADLRGARGLPEDVAAIWLNQPSIR